MSMHPRGLSIAAAARVIDPVGHTPPRDIAWTSRSSAPAKREAYDLGGSTDAAVVQGIGRTGRLVTSAALIVFLAFASMGTVPNLNVKLLATGLAAGVLLDALVVRSLLAPAPVSWLGRWNWWMPEPARRVLRLPPRPALEI